MIFCIIHLVYISNIFYSKTIKILRIFYSNANVSSLEDALGYIGQDEYVEITPLSIRLRKIYLTEGDRKLAEKK